jgi:hypothetical protein
MIIQLIFISENFIMERMMEEANMFALSPEQLLILLEEKLETGEITSNQLKEYFS